eukprot:9416850-Pyramimonas_sp.AAC.2
MPPRQPRTSSGKVPGGVRRRLEVSRATACLTSGESGGKRTPSPQPGPSGRRNEQATGRTPGGVVGALRQG